MSVERMGAKLAILGTAGIVYTYVGYPAVLWLATRNRHDDPPPMTEWPTVSIVIAAYNEAAGIADKLAETLALDYPGPAPEVVVVTDGSDDATPDLARRFSDPRVTVLHDPERAGKAAAVNRGVAEAAGDIVVFSDANNSFANDALVHLIRPFADPEVGGVTGAKSTTTNVDGVNASEGLYWRYEAAIRNWESRLASCTAANGEIMAARRHLIGPLPPGTINDDATLLLDLLGGGHRFVDAPDARSSEPPPATGAEDRERRARMSAGRFALITQPGRILSLPPVTAWQFVSHKVGRLLVPFLLLVTLGGSLISIGVATSRLLLVGQAGFYGLAALDRLRPPPGPLGRLAKVCRYLVESNAALAAGFVRFARGSQSTQWQKAARPSRETHLHG